MEAKLVQPWTNHIYTKIQHNLTRLQQTCQNSKTGKKFDTKLCFFGLQRKFCCPGPGGIPSLSFPYKLQNPTVDWDSMEKKSLIFIDCIWLSLRYWVWLFWGFCWHPFRKKWIIKPQESHRYMACGVSHQAPSDTWNGAHHVVPRVGHQLLRLSIHPRGGDELKIL